MSIDNVLSFTFRDRTFKIFSDPASEQMCQQYICRGETWEPWLTEYILDNLRPDTVVIDAGASVGWFTLLAAAHCPHGRIIAFEPNSRRHGMLAHSAAVNGFTNVTALRIALSDEAKVTTIGGRKEDQMGEPGQEIHTIRLDEILAFLGVDQVDLVKMDIEGAEVRALHGMEQTLRAPNIKVAMEVHPGLMASYGDTEDDLYALMEGHGFKRLSMKDEPPHSSLFDISLYKIFEKHIDDPDA